MEGKEPYKSWLQMLKRATFLFTAVLLVANMGLTGVTTVYSIFEDGSVPTHVGLEKIVSTVEIFSNGTAAEDVPFFAGAAASILAESVNGTESTRSDFDNIEGLTTI